MYLPGIIINTLQKRRWKVGNCDGSPVCCIWFGDSKNYVGHVGIINDKKKKLMIHASSKRGKVVISSYDTKYYNRKYRGIRRV